jgi:phosphopantothenoylcysteine synthetase/decarboxylase
MALTADRWQCQTYRTFEDLEQVMGSRIAGMHPDAVVHAAAVSDYLAAGVYAPASNTHFRALGWHCDDGTPTLRDCAAAKVKSSEPELWLRLVRAPKLVDRIRRDWSHAGILVKFKLEAGVGMDALLQIAERSRQHSSADWMVANTLEDAQAWAMLGNADGYRQVTRAELPGALLDMLETQYRESHHG